MAGFLRGLLETKAAGPSAKEAIARATGSSPGAAYSTGLGVVGAWDIDYAVKNGVEKVIWVFRCVDVIASNQAGINILLRKGLDRRNGKVIDDPRLWKLLNFRTNSYERSWQFRYRLSAILLLARRGAFIEVVNGADGRPSELHLLPPGVTEPVPHPTKFVEKYRVTRGDYKIEEIPAERVIWLRLKPHPTDPYAQMTPLMAAGIDVDTDYLARMFNRNFLANDGRPGMLITVDGGPGGLNPEDAEELKRRFGGGPSRAGQTTVIEGANIVAQDMASNPRDVQWGELLNTSKERLLLAFGVPESVMGNASGRTFDNADAEREGFWMDTMTNHCDNIAAGLDPLTGDIDDDTVFGHDFDQVDVLQRQLARKREEWRTEMAAGGITLNEYLKRTGQKEIDHPAARAYILPNMIAVPGKPEDEEILKKLLPIGTPPAPNPEAAARAGALKGTTLGMRHLENNVAARALRLAGKSTPKAIETKEVKRGDTDYPGYEGSIGPFRNQYADPHRYARDVHSGAGNCVCGAAEDDKLHMKQEPKVIEAIVVEKSHPYLGLRHRFEGAVEGVLTSWDTTQEKVVCERLMHVKSRKGTRHWDGTPDGVELKKLDSRYAVEIDRWVSDLKAAMEAIVTTAVKQELRGAAKDLDDNGVLDVLTAAGKAADKGTPTTRLFGSGVKVIDDIVGAVMDIVERAAKNQSERLAKKIEELDDSGADMKTIEAAIRGMTGTRAPWRKQLATNVVTTAVEGARHTVYTKAGKYVTKTWYTTGDERVRASHVRVDGAERKNGRAFKVGSSLLQYPGDPAGAPEDVINCRCFLEWHADFEELAK